jgi:signal transduction histidine kinase/ligand-binding sensor domain-containing protein
MRMREQVSNIRGQRLKAESRGMKSTSRMSGTSTILLRTSTSAFCFLLSALTLGSAQAQQPDIFSSEIPEVSEGRVVSPRFEKLGIEQGLSQSSILAMMQDRHGFMWFGTQDGLNRFDGYEVKTYDNVPFDSTSILDGWASALAEDADGRLWVGLSSGSGALSVMDPVSETFINFRHDPNDSTSIADGRPRSMVFDRFGALWIAFDGGTDGDGVDRMDPDRPGVFTHFRSDPDDPTSLSNDRALFVFEDTDGDVWVATRGGVNRFVPEPGRPDRGTFVRHLDGPSGDIVRSIFERPEEPGTLWLGTRAGLVRFEKETGTFERYLIDPEDPDANQVGGIAPDPLNRGVLWVSVYGHGIARFDQRAKRFFLYSADPADPNGLSDNLVNKMLTDRSGVIWVDASATVERFNPSKVGFEYVRSDRADHASMEGRSVWGVTLDSNNNLWLGAQRADDGAFELLAINRTDGSTTTYRHDDDDPRSLQEGQINQILEDRTGVIWVAAYGGGLSRLHRPSGKFYRFDIKSDSQDGLAFDNAFDIIEDRSGSIWICTLGSGVYRWNPADPDKFEQFRPADDDPFSIPTDGTIDLMEDQAGFIWVGHIQGLSRIDPLTGKATNYTHDERDPATLSADVVVTMHERRREPGIIWVGAAGLNRLDSNTGLVTHYTVEDGLPNNTVYAILEDEQGRLWMSTNLGLSRFDPETETFRNYGTEVGLQSLEFNLTAAHRAPSGEMFFGGINGLNAFFPNELIDSSVPPEVRLVDLKLGGETVRTDERVALDMPIPELDEIRLDHDQKDLTFDFVGFHYEHPEQNRFSYKLEGYNADWVDAGTSRSAPYTNLPPGDYTFRVRAANHAGVWNEQGASIRVVITPPLWATWWFRLLGVIAFAGIIYGGYRARTSQLEARARELEGLVDERTAELKESNDQLEQSATIVEAINEETSFRRLLTKILEEARVIPGIEKATAIVKMPDGKFHIRASSGWDVDAMQNIRLSPAEADARYVTNSEKVAEEIFVAKEVASRAGTEQMAEFGAVASFVVMRVMVEDDVVAYLVFDNLTDADAFDQRDVELLERLRRHIRSAFIKTRILEDLQTTLTDLQSTQDRLIQSEKMASLGQLTAGIAHEIKNPLNFVNNFSEMSTELTGELAEELEKRRGDLPDDFVAELEAILDGLKMNAEKIAEHGKRADGIVQNMLEHSKSGDGQRTPTDVNDLLEEYLVLAHHAQRAEEDGLEIHVERDLDDTIGKIEIVPQEMGRVFMNLIGNAFDALKEDGGGRMEEAGPPTVTVSTSKSGPNIEIRISDNGPGIPDDVKSKIFEPFFTTKPTGSGTGLGLSMSYDIVTKGHGGELTVESKPGQGATFIVRLPA